MLFWARRFHTCHFKSWNPDQGLAYPLKTLFGKYPYLALLLCGRVKDALITIVSRLPDPEAFAKLANRDEAPLIILVDVVCFLGGTMLPNELGDTYAVIYTYAFGRSIFRMRSV